jgi:hypothetical protein
MENFIQKIKELEERIQNLEKRKGIVIPENEYITLSQQSSTPANPTSGKNIIFTDTSSNSFILDSLGNKFYIVSESLGGWIPANETWTYASADAPTFTFTVSGNKTSKYSRGMRIKLTQSGTVKYFIITAVSYSAPNTTIAVYGGTNYTLANATISDNYYSTEKIPYGFPPSPNAWTVSVSDNQDRIQSSPAQSTWYNLGGISINIPIGIWKIYYEVLAKDERSGNFISFSVTLSTSSSSETDNNFTSQIQYYQPTNGSMYFANTFHKEQVLSLSSKTTYYLLMKQDNTSATAISFLGSVTPTTIKAISAYL